MASEGILFSRFYTEVGCTPSRAACMTGRHPIRNGMYNIGMLREMHGLRGTEVTIAEVLSEVGYATAFHGKWHLATSKKATPTTKASMKRSSPATTRSFRSGPAKAKRPTRRSASTKTCCPKIPYKLDDTFVTKGWVQMLEGKKGEQAQAVGRQQPRQLL